MSEKKRSSSLKITLETKEKEPPPAQRKRPAVSGRSLSISLGSDQGTPKDPGAAAKPKARAPAAKPKSKAGLPAVKKPAAKRAAPATNPKTATTKKKSVPKKKSTGKTRVVDLGSPRVLVPFMAAMLVLFAVMVTVRPVQHFAEKEGEPTVVIVQPGMSATAVSQLLMERGVVDDAGAILAFFVDQGIASTLRSGSFIMYPGMAHQAIGDTLSPPSPTRSVTAAPGFTIARIDALLVQRFGEQPGAFIAATDELARAHHLGFVEGWLLGETYTISGAEDLARQMYEAMLQAVQANLSSPLLATFSVEELLIIASLIQAETQNPAEMPGISAVIHNRLAIDEPLGIDATTRYELDDWISAIPVAALESQTPYNTRRKRGLPPTGISAPSAQAVAAAFFPEQRSDLFYLHGQDKQIHFALTYDDHRENIRRYR